jgi:2,5-diamino-6-(ribosylamino)-4(3H)-pyrimidinone 5'-phosphate reductase
LSWNWKMPPWLESGYLAQQQSMATAPRPGPVEAGPLLAVVDSKARVRQWEILREVGY